jgi:glucosamine 6-phosphate synthetase-like amidotransferase/phosphosugar isomerase protein
VIITDLPDITKFIDANKMDFIILLCPVHEPAIFSALQAVVPLQMICYMTAVKRGLNPDQQILKAIDFANDLD